MSPPFETAELGLHYWVTASQNPVEIPSKSLTVVNIPLGEVDPRNFRKPLNGLRSKQLLSNSTSTVEQTLIKPTAVPFT